MKNTEWIPNWKNYEEYPKVDSTTLYQWTWEFLRRNPAYQDACDELWSEKLINPPGKIIDMFDLSKSSAYPHYSSNSPTVLIPDDDEDDNSPEVVFPLRFVKDVVIILEPRDFETIDKNGGLEKNYLRGNWLKVEKYVKNKNLVYPQVDLSLSIDKQLKVISSYLKGWKKRVKFKNKRNRLSKFPEYLRIIDAIQIGEKNDRIRDTLYGHIANEHPEYSRQHYFQDSLKAAFRYRDDDYRYISQEHYPHIEDVKKL